MDLHGLRSPLFRSVYKVSAAETNLDIELGRVPWGHLWIVHWVAVEDETTAYTYLRILLKDFGKDHLLAEERSPLAARLYWSDKEIWIPEDKRLVARLNGTTNADKCWMYVHGIDVVLPKGVEFEPRVE